MKEKYKHIKLIIGCAILFIITLICFFPKLLTSIQPDEFFDEVLMLPTKEHILGTDGLGRDLFSLLLYSTKSTLLSGFAIAFFSGIIGILIGSIAAIGGKFVDNFLVEMISVFSIIPSVFFIIILSASFKLTFFSFVLVSSLSFWTGTARIVRSQVKKTLQQPFVKELIRIGVPKPRVLVWHILPNSIQPVLSNIALSVANACMLEAGLSFVNVKGTEYSLGTILSHGQRYIMTNWRITAAPIATILIICLSFLLIADAVNTKREFYE